MILRFLKSFLVVFLLVTSVSMEARSPKYFRLRGEQMYLDGRYREALDMFKKFEKGVEDDYVYDEAYLHRKAEVNYKLGKFDEALYSYYPVLENDKDNVNYRFFKELIYRSSEPNNFTDVLAIIDSVDLLAPENMTFQDTVSRFTVRSSHLLNTEFSEFGAVECKGRVYFSSITDRRFVKKDINTKLTHYDIYSTVQMSKGELSIFDDRTYMSLSDIEKKTLDSLKAKCTIRYEKGINTRYNDGPIAFYNDDEAFVTVNEIYEENGKSDFRLSLKQVMLSDNPADLLSDDVKHFFGEYFWPSDVGQITFSKDGTKACMAVKVKNSSSNTDLWFSELEDSQQWGAPYRAGDNINTEFNDLFPFWSDDNYLYYSSDGLSGLGGLDIYRVDMNDQNSLPHNLGPGINSIYDDFAFSIDSFGKGYLTSDRIEGRGFDDIYSVSMKYGCVRVVLVSDMATVDNPLFTIENLRDASTIDSLNIKKDSIYFSESLPYGDYNLAHSFPVDTSYEQIALYDDTVTVYVNFPDLLPDNLPVSFTNFCFNCREMDDINEDKFKRLISFLADFPEIEILLTGNTDMFGKTDYNNILGMRRANHMEQWLRNAGVVNPIAKASNGKDSLLSQTDHRLNRRVDIELFWPGDDKRLTFVSSDDGRLTKDLVIEYDAVKELDEPLVTGYYLKVYSSRFYMKEETCATKYGIGENPDILLYSTKWNKFDYYINIPFETSAEAQAYLDKYKSKAKIVYLKR